MVMALRTLNRHAQKSVGSIGNHIITIEMARNPAIDFALGHFSMTDEIPRAGCNKTQSFDSFGSAREKHITRKLL